ncbi:MAG: Rossmann-like and DUF2520 domain-containing protein [Emergencia sp.]
MKAGFIGAGKVGFSLGKYLETGGITVSGYYSRTGASAREAAAFTGSRYYEDLAGIISDSDTLFITVPDGAIGDVWDDMHNLPIENKNICHCSGSISSAVFFDAEERGAYRFSVHPLYAVSDRYESYRDLSKAYFAIEGSEARLSQIRSIFEKLGNPAVVIDSGSKTLYHAAAVMVSNQMAALADIGAQLLTECGFEREAAEKALAPLIEGNALKIAQVGPCQALTGPVERGDAGTVRRHMEVLPQEIRPVYQALSRQLVSLAERKHPDRNYEELEKELRK